MDNSDESDYGEDMLQMVEDEDIEFLKNAIDKKSYNIFKRIKHVRGDNAAKKRKVECEGNIEAIENSYEEQLEQPKDMKILLPIKTKTGIMTRTVSNVANIDDETNRKNNQKDYIEYNTDNTEIEYVLDKENDNSIPKSSADLMVCYNQSLRNRKVHIGYLCSNLLENPEEKVSNFRILFNIFDDEVLEASLSIKKLVIVSLLEVFKDLLPSYQIKHQDAGNVKLKKDTLKLQKFEDTLLQYYKKYLQRLEKLTSVILKKPGDMRKLSSEDLKLSELAVHAMCDLLVTHPYFNFSPNIAQTIVPFLNHQKVSIRQIVLQACKELFKEDKKEEITLKILRVLNNYLKNKAHKVRPDMLQVLLYVKIRDVNLDQEKENEMKQKKIMSHKQNVLKLSKKERKRKKRLQELENEMLETKAEENKQTKQKNLTEITKIVFGIYFRILKSSNNTKVLGVCLEGLVKYSHCINLEYYVDLLNLLNGLINEEWLGYREQMHCIQTVFAILHNQDDSVNLDPTRFYTCLYSNLLQTHASKTNDNCEVVLKTLTEVLIRRRKKVTNKRTIGFAKRIATLSLQLLHNGSLGALALIKQILMLNKSVDILLDLDTSLGDGDYQAELMDPEYCNASSTSLYELILLKNSYHAIVCKFANHIANGLPSTGAGVLPIEFNKCSPEQLFHDYDMSEMAFNPPIQIPKKIQPKFKRKKMQFVDLNFKQYCNSIVKNSVRSLFS